MNILGVDIPTEVLSVLMSLCGGAIGAFILQIIQRKHHTSERNIGTRKQVYFEACDALAVIQASLTNILNSPLSESRPDPNLAAAIMRLHIVGRFKLVEHLMEFQSLYAQALLDMGMTKMEIEGIQAKSKHASEMHKMYSDFYREWTEKLNVQVDEESRKQIISIINEWGQKRDNCLAYQNQVDPAVPPLQLRLLEKNAHHLMKMSIPANNCMLEMRKDLDIPFTYKETKKYLDYAEKYRNIGRRKIKTFISIISKKIENDDFPDL